MGIIDRCISLRATKRFFSPGEITLKLAKAVDGLMSAAAIYEPFSKGCYLIEAIECSSVGEITVKGRSLESLLERRILNSNGRYAGNAEQTVRLAVETNTTGERALSGLVLGETVGLDGDGYFSADYRNLSEFVYTTLRTFGASYTVELVDGVPTFRVVTGKDRTRAQSKYVPVVLSESMGNVIMKRTWLDVSRQKNTAYVTGSDGRCETVTLAEGENDRRELYVNARDLAPAGFAVYEEYSAALRMRGIETLRKYGGEWRCTGSVTDIAHYGADYALGDVCDVDTSLGISLSERMTSVEFCFEKGCVTVSTSFGEV